MMAVERKGVGALTTGGCGFFFGTASDLCLDRVRRVGIFDSHLRTLRT